MFDRYMFTRLMVICGTFVLFATSAKAIADTNDPKGESLAAMKERHAKKLRDEELRLREADCNAGCDRLRALGREISAELDRKHAELDTKRVLLDAKQAQLDAKESRLDRQETEHDRSQARLNEREVRSSNEAIRLKALEATLRLKTTELNNKKARLVAERRQFNVRKARAHHAKHARRMKRR